MTTIDPEKERAWWENRNTIAPLVGSVAMNKALALLDEIERLRAYVGQEDLRSDFKCAADMRAALERLREELEEMRERVYETPEDRR